MRCVCVASKTEASPDAAGWLSRRRDVAEFFVVLVAQPTDILADEQRSEAGESAGVVLHAQEPRQVLSVDAGVRVERRLGVHRVADLEVEVRVAIRTVGQHLGEHGDHSVLVLGEPRERFLRSVVHGSQVLVVLDEFADDRSQHSAVQNVVGDSVDHLYHRQRHSHDSGQLITGAFDRRRRLVEPKAATVHEVPVSGVFAQEVHFEALEETQFTRHVPVGRADRRTRR